MANQSSSTNHKNTINQLGADDSNNNNQNSLNPILMTLPGFTGTAAHAVAAINAGISTNNSTLSHNMPSTNTHANLVFGSNVNSNNADNSNDLNNNSGIIDLIMCKLTSSFHVINDPRLLECGSSACFQCIVSLQDNEHNLKCSYCNGVHKVPADLNKLLVNKNLQNFLKTNMKQINQSFSKQLETSLFAFDQKIKNHNLMMDNFEQYLTLMENDMKIKIETMRNQLEKYGEQFIENIKQMRKEVIKKFQTSSKEFESLFNVFSSPINQSSLSSSSTNKLDLASASCDSAGTTANNLGLNINKNSPYHIIGLKNDTLLPGNINAFTVLSPSANNSNNTVYQISSSYKSSNNSSSMNSNLHHPQQPNQISYSHTKRLSNMTLINNKNALIPQNDSLQSSLDSIPNINFSNSSSWNTNDDDLEDFETELNLKLTSNTCNNATNNANNPSNTSNTSVNNIHGQKRHLNKEQAQFNKFVREEVSKKFGEDFLLQHEVNQLESSIMELIKSEAISSFLPKDTSPSRAWTLAKVSLRSLKRDLRRKQNKMLPSKFLKSN